jgi:hypothetical protein
MIRTMPTALFALAVSQAALADVTLKTTDTGQGLGMSGDTTTTVYIKGLKMRIDGATSRRSTSTIFDVENQKMYVLDARKKEANVWDMAAFSQEIATAVTVGEMQASLEPNGQTRTIAGQSTDGYDLNISLPATLGGAGGMPITMALTGTTWIAKGVPGAADYAAFYQGAAERGWIFSDPQAAKASPGQAKALAQMYTEFARIGGIPYESQTSIKIQGDGPMAAMMSRMGAVSMTSRIESVDTGSVSDELFQPPADFKLNQE